MLYLLLSQLRNSDPTKLKTGTTTTTTTATTTAKTNRPRNSRPTEDLEGVG